MHEGEKQLRPDDLPDIFPGDFPSEETTIVPVDITPDSDPVMPPPGPEEYDESDEKEQRPTDTIDDNPPPITYN